MEPTTCQEWIWNKTIIGHQPQPSIFHSQVLQTEKPSTEVTGTSNRIICHIPSLLRAEWAHALSLSFKLHVLKHTHTPARAYILSSPPCHIIKHWEMPLIVALARRSLLAISEHQAELVPLVTRGHSGLDRASPVAISLPDQSFD